jgi:hypothetical protein
MIESSKDILYIVISIAILLLTIFTVWGMYYLIMILREAKKMITDMRKKIELVEKVLIAAKERLESTSSHMKLLVETALNVAEYVKDRKTEKKSTKKKKK